MALSRTGYPKATGCEVSTLDDEVFAVAEPFSKANTSTSWSAQYSRGNSVPGDGGLTSPLEEEFEDLTEIINAELTKLDREIVNYVAHGSSDVPSTPQLPNASLESLLSSNLMSSNGTFQSGLPLGAPKSERISIEDEVNCTEPLMQPPSIPTQTLGNLPVGSYPDDTKPDVIPMEQGNMSFQLSSSKMRGVNSPCMFSSASSAAERNYQQNAPTLSHVNTSGNSTLMGTSQQIPSARNTNNMKASGVLSRSVAFTSTSQGMMFGRLPSQRQAVTSTVTSGSSISQMANQKEQQLQFIQLLKEAIPENMNYTDEMVVDLVDDMMNDRDDEAQRRKDDRLASLVQQGEFMQTEPFIKQEVITPTLPQPTFSFPSVTNSMASQSSQPLMPTSTFTSGNTFSQLPGNETAFGVTSRRPQNETVNNMGSPASFQNGNLQFMNQEDSNMNFLNSLSNTGIANKHTVLPGNTPWSTNPPLKQNVMQQGIRNLLQSTSAPSQSTNSGLFSQSNMSFLPPQTVNSVPQDGSRITQVNSFNMTMLPNSNQLDPLLQSGQLPAPGYQNFNGTNMSFGNQNYPKFDMSRKL